MYTPCKKYSLMDTPFKKCSLIAKPNFYWSFHIDIQIELPVLYLRYEQEYLIAIDWCKYSVSKKNGIKVCKAYTGQTVGRSIFS